MYARLFDVLLNRSNHASVLVSQGVHVKLGSAFKKLIDQDWPVGRETNCSAHIFVETFFIINDGHGTASQDIAGSHQHRITDLLCNLLRFLAGSRHSVFGLRDAELSQQSSETLAASRKIDCVSCRADNGNPSPVQAHSQVQGRLSTKLDDHSFGLLQIDDVHNILESQRLEVETVGSIVVSRDRFRIAVDHDCFEAGVAQCKRGVATAIVKLNSLSDAVWPGTQDHDLASIGWRGF